MMAAGFEIDDYLLTEEKVDENKNKLHQSKPVASLYALALKVRNTAIDVAGFRHITSYSPVTTVPDITDPLDTSESERDNLLLYLIEEEEKYRVLRSEPSVKKIQEEAEFIVERLFDVVGQLDPRFRCKAVPTGSFYEDVKVIKPDEFDYMAEIEALSRGSCHLLSADEAGFAFCVIDTGCKDYDEFASVICKVHRKYVTWYCSECSNTVPQGMSFKLFEPNLHVVGKYDHPSLVNLVKVLDPNKIQEYFRKLVVKSMNIMTEDNAFGEWEAGGFNRPYFSGVRRHGPATLLQFVAPLDEDCELRVNIDITLAILMPVPMDLNEFKFQVMKELDPHSSTYVKLHKALTEGPGVHLIPLYSKMMLAKGKYNQKNTWRVSCNMIESKILNSWEEHSVPKKLLRILKILKYKFLTDGKRKTCRRRKRKFRVKRKKTMSLSEGRKGRGGRPAFPSRAEKEAADEARASPIIRQDSVGSSSDPGDTEEKTPLEAQELYDMLAPYFEMKETEIMRPQPGTGEYYGPRELLHSIEFKTIVLRMLEKHQEPSSWTEHLIPHLVRVIFHMFKSMLSKKQTMTNFFFQTFVCTPCNDKMRNEALKRLDKLLTTLKEISKG